MEEFINNYPIILTTVIAQFVKETEFNTKKSENNMN